MKRTIRLGCSNIIDGKKIGESIRGEVRRAVARISREKSSSGATQPLIPGLGVIICGSRKDSQTYVRLKHKAANECGFNSIQIELPEDVTQEQLEAKIKELNADPACHAMLVQLPLPDHLDEARALEKIEPKKDADGLHPVNVGLMNIRGKRPYFYPCTARGIVELLDRRGVEIESRHAVVIGRSNIVGQPVAQMLLNRQATVTVCHDKTVDLDYIAKHGDIIIAACGCPELVRGEWVKPGAAVIDVGTNIIEDKSSPTGFRMVGDVDFSQAVLRAGHITPVPGGVGPMTIAMLLSNTLRAYKRSLQLPEDDEACDRV